MTMVRVHELPRDHEGMARFLALATRARDADPILGAGPPDDDASILLPSSEEGGIVPAALFVASDHEEDVARCAAMAPDFVPGSASGEGAAGAIGFWSTLPGHDEAAEAVLTAAREWLAARGLDAVGPVDLSTWHRYRFVVEGFENGRFLLEPWNRPDEVRVWERAGFARATTHATVQIPLREYPALQGAHDEAIALGVSFVDLASLPSDEALGALYDVVKTSFIGKSGFAVAPRERFFSLYAGAALLLTPGLSYVARDREGKALGFAFGYPDWLEPMRTALPEPTTTVLKTLARTPEAPPWLGYALCHQHIVSARERGYASVLFALMERWAALARVGRSQGAGARIWKRYSLFRSSR